MKSNGIWVSLADICINRGEYGIAASAVDYDPKLISYLRISDIRDDGSLDLTSRKSVADPKAENYMLLPNDIVFARTGNSTGRNYFYDPRDGKFAYAGFLIKFSIDPKLVNPHYIKYYCQSSTYWNWVASFNSGSTRGNINAKTYGSMPVFLPSRCEQDFIAKICDSISDKIRVNNKINDYLEQSCQLLFDRFSSDKTNPFVPVASIANINPKRTIKKGETAPYIEMANLSTRGAFPSEWKLKTYTSGMKFINGDTIIARITPCLENGKAGYINFLEDGQTAFGSTEYIVINTKGDLPPEYFYFLVRNPEFVTYAIAHMNGTSGRQRVSSSDIEHYQVRIPSERQLKQFNALAIPAMQFILKSSMENRKLTEVLNSLLPELMSGEIDVSKIKLSI